MKFIYKLVFLILVFLSNCQGVGELKPFHIACFDNYERFLQKHVTWKYIIHKTQGRFSYAGQLYKWRVPDKKELTLDDFRRAQCYVRVLLAELKKNNECLITSPQGFFLSSSSCKEGSICNKNELNLHFSRNEIFINYKKVGSLVWIKPQTQTLFFNDHEYRGSFLCMMYQNMLLIINEVTLEDYVYCVLNAESWPGWPLEVNKAFAIASRSYALAKVLENTALKNKKPYHFKNTNKHQTYKGYHRNARLLQAIHETEGMVVTYERKPIMAMFDCCCGGVIPAHLSGVDFEKAPYLKRTNVCSFCKTCKIYRWQLEIGVNEFKKILACHGYHVKSLDSIGILKKDKAGAVQKIVIKDRNKQVIINGKAFYSLIKNVKSFCYDIEKKGNTIFIVQGKGYGHHLGICQWGARAMIDRGYTFDKILDFYYPSTRLMKVAVA